MTKPLFIAKPDITQKEIDAVVEVMKSGMIAQGPKVKALEEAFAVYCQAKFGVAVNSGTAALHAALYALGITEGDEVITTPFTFLASANSILMQGATPVFADINPETFNIDPASVQEKITDKTKAVMAVDLYGQLADYDALKAVCGDIPIIADSSQAIGATFRNEKAGKHATLATYSLYATKNLTSGEGGVVVTNDEELTKRMQKFRHHGQDPAIAYECSDLGFNYRMTDIGAAIALTQLDRIEGLNDQRRKNAQALNEGLKNLSWLKTPVEGEDKKHVYHQYTIRIDASIREKLISHLKEHEVNPGIYYPSVVYASPYYQKLGYKKGICPIAEKTTTEVLCLPIHSGLHEEDMKQIVSAFQSFTP